MSGSVPYRICVVCSGNICRSPMAEVILRHALNEAGLGEQVEVDSAGTGDWHIGEQADARALEALTDAGYDGDAHRARQFDGQWFDDRDLILAAGLGHYRQLRGLATTPEAQSRIRMLREFDDAAVASGDLELDDPWYGTKSDFQRCREEIEAAAPGIVKYIREELAGR